VNTTDNLSLAESYYNAMLAKDFDRMAGYLHDNVHFIGPLAEMQGKDTIVTAAKNFGKVLHNIQIRARFSSDNQIMLAYDMVVSAPIGKFRAAVMMEFTDQLISKIELFYDARPFQK
jgi:hypothetical protein